MPDVFQLVTNQVQVAGFLLYKTFKFLLTSLPSAATVAGEPEIQGEVLEKSLFFIELSRITSNQVNI